MVKKVLSLFAILIAPLVTSQCTTHIGLETIKQQGELVVAMDVDVPGYFVMGNQNYGFQYDLLEQYAQSLGVKLRVEQDSIQHYNKMLKEREADIIALPKQHLEAKDSLNAIHIYNTSFVVLTKRSSAASEVSLQKLLKLFDGNDVLISHAFTVTDTYKMLVDSCPNFKANICSEDSFEMMRMLSDNECDYMICELSESQIGRALANNIRLLHTFPEQMEMYIVVHPKMSSLEFDFQQWLKKFQDQGSLKELHNLYFSRGIVSQVINSPVLDAQHGCISIYDSIIKDVTASSKYDWRMISAIVYNESKFNEFTISHRGAKGLMQIMPCVARSFNVKQDDLLTPHTNLTVGIKLLESLDKSLSFAAKTSFEDRMSLILASYHAGIGHVLDARRLAVKHGGNRDHWKDVAPYLLDKGKWKDDEEVRCGHFNGRSTLKYVDNVLKVYKQYCSMSKATLQRNNT